MPAFGLQEDRSDTPDRRERLEVYNGEFQTTVSPATGFRDEIDPVDETVESMAAAATAAHQKDEGALDPKLHDDGKTEDGTARSFPMTEIHGPDENAEHDHGIIKNYEDMNDDLAPKKKKRKSRKPASKRGMNKPTGFEDNYADAPMTVEQIAEQREVYKSDIPFVDRVLTAIQRFERTRKLFPERRDVFYKYLAYGGVDIGPNMFQGRQNINDMEKDDFTVAMAQANISEDQKATIVDPKKQTEAEEDAESTGDPASELEPAEHFLPEHQAKYTVDFLATMKAFLSYRAPVLFGFETQERVDMVTTTLERFMDYLMQNEVCLEYTDEILSARNLCRTARTELWHCAEAQRWLPGDFNIACSTLFDGQYGRNYDGKTYWGEPQPGENVFVGLTPEEATQIVGFGIAGAAPEDIYAQYHEIYHNQDGKFEIVESIRDHGFEITALEEPTAECIDLYKGNTAEHRPVGRVHAKFWPNPGALSEDLTATERAAQAPGKNTSPYRNRAFLFFIESTTILPFLRVGQKIEATIHKLNCGVSFFDEFIRIYPSFETWIENEKTYGWKEPKALKGSLEFDLEEARQKNEGTLVENSKIEAAVAESTVNYVIPQDGMHECYTELKKEANINGDAHENGTEMPY